MTTNTVDRRVYHPHLGLQPKRWTGDDETAYQAILKLVSYGGELWPYPRFFDLVRSVLPDGAEAKWLNNVGSFRQRMRRIHYPLYEAGVVVWIENAWPAADRTRPYVSLWETPRFGKRDGNR